MTGKSTLSSPRKSNTARSTSTVMLCTLASRILGFFRTALIGALFGASGQADVLNAVFSIPNNLRKLFAEGALSSAFIPELSRQIVEDNSGTSAIKLSRNIIGLQTLILIPVIIFSLIFPDLIIKIFIQFENPEKMDLAIDLFRWIMGYIFLISISSVIMAVLNSYKRFLIPALTPLLFSIAVISSLILFHKKIGIFSMVVGVLVGGVGQIMFQLPSFLKLGYTIIPEWSFSFEPFKKVIKQWGPVLLTSSIFTLVQQVAVLLASKMQDGSSSALANALVFFQLPFGLFAASITTVLFPKMSRQSARNELSELKVTIQSGIKSLIVFLLPSALFLMIFGTDYISLAFQRGAFLKIHSIAAGEVLFAYCTGMFSVAAYNFLQRVFYSLGDYKKPIISAAVVAFIDITLSLLAVIFNKPVKYLAYANSIAFTTGLILLFVILHIKLNHFNLKSILLTLIKVLISLLPAILIFIASRFIWGGSISLSGPKLIALLKIGLITFLSVASILLCYYLLKIEFMSMLLKRGSNGKKN